MNYYKFNIGDYAAATRHLTMLEHGAYRLLLDLYYTSEQPIPLDLKAAARKAGARSKDEVQAVETVLQEFFTETQAGWTHARCETEIAFYQQKAETNRVVGKKGGRPKKQTTAVVAGNPEKTQTVSEINPQETLTTNQEPLTNNHSVTDVTASEAGKSAEQLTKAELWSAGKSLLEHAGMPVKQCGTFVGKLVKDYGDTVVIDAVRAAVVARPADPAEYLKATCQHAAGQRTQPNKQVAIEQRNQAAVDAWLNQDQGAVHA